MAVTIAVLSQKGGTGKTTAVRTVADILRRIDVGVLSVDLDPQGNLSDYFDIDPDASPTVGDVLSGRAQAADAVHGAIIPANLGLAEAELMLSGRMGRELTLKRALRNVKDAYEVVLIDCPPALGFALQGVEQALEVINLARESLNPSLEWLGVLLNIADMRTRHSREAFSSLREHYGEKLLDTTIRASIAYAESAERAVSILDYRPDLAADYLNVTDELLRRLGMDDARTRLGALVSGTHAAA
jgi:chromosome partitioning protein